MSHKSPLSMVNETFGGKDKLVDKLVGLLESDDSKEDLRKKLLGVANSKLLRLHRVAAAVKETYGSRDKLLEQTVTTLGRGKDKDYRTRLDGYSTSRLFDIAAVAARRAKAAESAAAGVPKAKARAKTTARSTTKTTTRASEKPTKARASRSKSA